MLAQLRGAIAGGVDAVQIREPGLAAREYIQFIRAAVALPRPTGCRILVNDRLDLAVAGGADGIHLRESSIPVSITRRFVDAVGSDARRMLVGRSVHDTRTAVLVRSADYMIAGSVFETESKPGRHASLGLDGLREVVRAAEGCPVWAVGGVTPDRVASVLDTGARGVAAIGAFLPIRGSTSIERDVQAVTEALRLLLDRHS